MTLIQKAYIAKDTSDPRIDGLCFIRNPRRLSSPILVPKMAIKLSPSDAKVIKLSHSGY